MNRFGAIAVIVVAAAVLLLFPVTSQAAQICIPPLCTPTLAATATDIVIQPPTPVATMPLPTAAATDIVIPTATIQLPPTLPPATATEPAGVTATPVVTVTPAGTVVPVLAAVDLHLAVLWPVAQQRQLNYLASNGRYFQGLLSHSQVPADGIPAVPDNAGSHPTDQGDNWQQFFGVDLPLTMPYAIRVDVYDGPQGQGFVTICYVRIGGQLWSQAIATGPEAAGREHDWQLVGGQLVQ